MVLEGLLRALVSEKGGTREMKMEDMNGKENILVQGGIVLDIPINVRCFQTRAS